MVEARFEQDAGFDARRERVEFGEGQADARAPEIADVVEIGVALGWPEVGDGDLRGQVVIKGSACGDPRGLVLVVPDRQRAIGVDEDVDILREAMDQP